MSNEHEAVNRQAHVGKIEQFEDLIAWQRARNLTAAIYRASSQGRFSGDLSLARQIQRAAVSIMANIAEGFERGNRKEFHHFLSIAKASCAEVRSHLYIAHDIGYLDQGQFESLSDQARELGRIIGALRVSVARRPAPSPIS